jgi:hypothetical protein
MIEAYPLQWPIGYPRTKWPGGNYKFIPKTFGYERDELMRELKRMGARDIVLSTNVALKQDGLPYADYSRKGVSDRGVAVYFTIDKEPMTLCCDKWNSLEANVRAISMSVDAMRSLDRWGVSEILKRVFTGFKTIPQKVDTKPWWEVLGISARSSKDDIKKAYWRLAKIHHPDTGGNIADFNRISDAYQFAMSQ